MALAVRRCFTSKFDVPSSNARSYGLRTLLPEVKVCEVWPSSVARASVYPTWNCSPLVSRRFTWSTRPL